MWLSEVNYAMKTEVYQARYQIISKPSPLIPSQNRHLARLCYFFLYVYVYIFVCVYIICMLYSGQVWANNFRYKPTIDQPISCNSNLLIFTLYWKFNALRICADVHHLQSCLTLWMVSSTGRTTGTHSCWLVTWNRVSNFAISTAWNNDGQCLIWCKN